MNKQRSFLVTLLVIALLVSACAAPAATPTVQKATEEAGPTATPSKTPQASGQVVVTATGMSDLGNLLGEDEIPASSSSNPVIDWDQNFKSAKFELKPCLFDEAVDCYYAQTSVSGSFDVDELLEEMPFVVPNGWYLVAGGNKAGLTLTNGYTQDHTGGYLFALSSNTSIKYLSVIDGFLVLVPAANGQAEFCARLKQAVDQKWDRKWNYGDEAWGKDPCEGYEGLVVPLDSDRYPVVTTTPVAAATP